MSRSVLVVALAEPIIETASAVATIAVVSLDMVVLS
jgi:hypothetical protein